LLTAALRSHDFALAMEIFEFGVTSEAGIRPVEWNYNALLDGLVKVEARGATSIVAPDI
jgi:hypothetical protein